MCVMVRLQRSLEEDGWAPGLSVDPSDSATRGHWTTPRMDLTMKSNRRWNNFLVSKMLVEVKLQWSWIVTHPCSSEWGFELPMSSFPSLSPFSLLDLGLCCALFCIVLLLCSLLLGFRHSTYCKLPIPFICNEFNILYV